MVMAQANTLPKRQKPELANALAARCFKLQLTTPPGASHPCLLSSSRAMALIVPPSARPLNWGRTFPITAPICFAPPAIAAFTAARSSSSLTCAGRYFSSAAASLVSLSARSLRLPLVVHLDRFAPALDRLAEDVDHVCVGGIASQLDLLVLDLREDRAEQERAGLVLGLSRARIEIALKRASSSDIP